MRLPLIAAKIGAKLGLVPRWAWIALAAAVVIFIGYRVIDGHFHRGLETARKEASAARDVAWQARFDKMKENARIWKERYEKASTDLAQARRNSFDATLRDDAVRTGSLLVRGPGKATAETRCGPVSNTGAGSAAGGRQPTSGPGPASVAGVPDAGRPLLASVPWNDLVTLQQFCAANRTESLTWRAHDAEQRALSRGARPVQ